MNAFDILNQRGFIYQSSHEQELRDHLSEPRTVYAGFDPTADSFHVGNLVPLMALKHVQQCGHRVIALVGGGTARVGDPSGKTEMRPMLSEAQLKAHEAGLSRQLTDFLGLEDSRCGILLNNDAWLSRLGFIAFLRDIGVHFSVNRMLTAESVKLRLETGLSFIEFTYSLLQAYDFFVLHRDHGCTFQIGGQDQWGNIVAGIDLCRRKGSSQQTFGLTLPLLTNSSGAKFGKSVEGAVWLDGRRTPPFEFYQFWRNSEDADVAARLAMFTLLPMDEIQRLANPAENINRAKEILAFEVTRLVHGPDQAAQCFASAATRFGQADPDLRVPTTSSIVQVKIAQKSDLPQVSVPAEELADMTWTRLFVRAGLASSNSDARRLIQGNGARVNDRLIENGEDPVDPVSFAQGPVILRAGKKRFKQVVVE